MEGEQDDEDLIIIDEESGEALTDAPAEDTTEPEVIAAETTPAPAAPAPETDAYEVLKRNFDALEAQRATDQARLAELEAARAGTEADQDATNAALLKAAGQAAKAELQAAKRVYAEAAAKGDHAAMADAQELIADKVLEARQYAAAEADWEASAAERKRARTAPAPKPQTPAEVPYTARVDAFIDTLPPKVKEWAKANKDVAFGTEPSAERTQKLEQAHYKALGEGYAVDSPEYIAVIDRTIKGTPQRAKPTPQRRAPPMASAPVNRGGTPPANTVTLSKAERDMATRLGMTPAKYGAYKRKAQAGAADPDYKGPRYSKDDPALSGAR